LGSHLWNDIHEFITLCLQSIHKELDGQRLEIWKGGMQALAESKGSSGRQNVLLGVRGENSQVRKRRKGLVERFVTSEAQYHHIVIKKLQGADTKPMTTVPNALVSL